MRWQQLKVMTVKREWEWDHWVFVGFFHREKHWLCKTLILFEPVIMTNEFARRISRLKFVELEKKHTTSNNFKNSENPTRLLHSAHYIIIMLSCGLWMNIWRWCMCVCIFQWQYKPKRNFLYTYVERPYIYKSDNLTHIVYLLHASVKTTHNSNGCIFG